eukprot:jgi/Galph1/302/GphlegSOOS_G5029.1
MQRRPQLRGFFYDATTDRYFRRTSELRYEDESLSTESKSEHGLGIVKNSTEKNGGQVFLQKLIERETNLSCFLNCADITTVFHKYSRIELSTQESVVSGSFLPRLVDFDINTNTGIRASMLPFGNDGVRLTVVYFTPGKGFASKIIPYYNIACSDLEFARLCDGGDSFKVLLLGQFNKYQRFILFGENGTEWVSRRKRRPYFCLEMCRSSLYTENMMVGSGHASSYIRLESISSQRSLQTCNEWNLKRNSDVVTLDFINNNILVAATRSGEGVLLDSRQPAPCFMLSLSHYRKSKQAPNLCDISGPLKVRTIENCHTAIFSFIGNRLELWDLRWPSKSLVKYKGHQTGYSALPISVSSCCDLVTCGSSDGYWKVWDLKKGGWPLVVKNLNQSGFSPLYCSFLSGHPPRGVFTCSPNNVAILRECNIT